MHNEDKDMTLGQLFKVVKKSGIRALIYVLVSVIIATAVLFTVKELTKSATYYANINISVDGENPTAKMQSSKMQVANNALVDLKGSATGANEIAYNLSITPIMPENINKDDANATTTPTGFNLTLKPSSKLTFTATEYQEILQTVAQKYVNMFGTSPFTSSTLYKVAEQTSRKEYYETTDEILDEAELIRTKLNNAKSTLNTANNTINMSIINEIDNILFDINQFILNVERTQDDILANNYQKGELLKYLEQDLARIEREITATNANLTQAKEIYNGLPKNDTVLLPDSNTTTDVSSAETQKTLREWANKVQAYTESLSRLNKQKETLNAKISEVYNPSITATAEDKTAIQAELVAYETALNAIIADYNGVLENYNQDMSATSIISISSQAIRVESDAISMMILIIIIVLVALIAYLTAFIQVYGKMKKNGTLYGNPVPSFTTVNTASSAQAAQEAAVTEDENK